MKRLQITVIGCVQGVGFRPFIYRLANQYQLAGSIRNTTLGVEIIVQGDLQALSYFQKDLLSLKPERASITQIMVLEKPLQNSKNFEIKGSSTSSETELALLPDTALCPTCFEEFSDPKNRRYRYPFVHCMTCGPRFSLFVKMPFDRANTTMADFTMCEICQTEYSNPENRRFYSQTNCCPKCGPKLTFLDKNNKEITSQQHAVEETIKYIQNGLIVAVKNTGGYLFLVDATNEHAIKRLRLFKQRAKKPFALLMPSLSYAKKIAFVPQIAEEVLTSYAAPIVLLKKIQHLAPSVSFDSPYHGIMLPHNALQHLLLSSLQIPLIATSGNISHRPLCITEEEAFSELSNVADAFLIHNRRITHRLDDSVVQIISDRPMLIRRARGYIPYALSLPEQLNPSSSCILAAGGHLKNGFAIAKKNKIYVSQYIGDLDSCETCQSYDNEVTSWETLLSITPSSGVGDMHPEYYTSHYLQNRALKTNTIQHHKAHVWSGMLDNQIKAPLLGFSWDGTGYGDDRTIWGGESFIVDKKGMNRFSSLYPFMLPGSEKAIHEPRRSALGILHAMFKTNIPSHYKPWLKSSFNKEELNILLTALEKKINSPICSSMGRFFDAISALLDCSLFSHFEGEAAMALEGIAERCEPRYNLTLLKQKDLWIIDWRPMVHQIFEDKIQGVPLKEIAFSFHHALAESIVAIAHTASIEKVLLTGGVMQNKLLADMAIARLKQEGFNPFWHHNIPPNDGGLAVGQLLGNLLCV